MNISATVKSGHELSFDDARFVQVRASGASSVAGKASFQIGILPVCTLVIWGACLAIGLMGLFWPYQKPRMAVATPVIHAELLDVALTETPSIPVAPHVEQAPLAEPPPLPQMAEVPEMPPAIPVAALSPAVAFALPVEGPTQVVPIEKASFAAVPATETAEPAVQPMVYGVGEGAQPSPVYPRIARREGQEGEVIIRFRVDSQGRVRDAKVFSPSPWPLLNDAALAAVRDRWSFKPGPVRLHDVLIKFTLTQ